jgi:Laminin G domain
MPVDGGAADAGVTLEGASAQADSAAPDATTSMRHVADGGAIDADATQGEAATQAEAAADAGSADSGRPDADASSGHPTDAKADGPRCTDDLSDIGTADFHIAFSLATATTAQTGLVALLSQRSVCTLSAFWSVRIWDGALYVETEENADATHVALTTSGPQVNDGRPHDILIRRVAQTLAVLIDGTSAGTIPDPTSFAALPLLKMGTDPCVGGPDGTAVLSGTLTSVCITSP